MKLIGPLILLLCAWSVASHSRPKRNTGQVQSAPAPAPARAPAPKPLPVAPQKPAAPAPLQAPQLDVHKPVARPVHLVVKPSPVIPVYASGGKTVIKTNPSGHFQVVRQNVARQARGRLAIRGFGWVRQKGLHLPPWASKAIIILPLGARRSVVSRPGIVKTGSKIYHVVKVVQIQSAPKVEQLAQELLELVFQKRLINAQVGAKIIHAFGLKATGPFANQPKQVLQVNTMTVKGLIKARNRFVRGLHILLNRQAPQANKVKFLVKNLFQLVLDNELLRIPAAISFGSKFGVRIQVLARSQGISFVHKPGTVRFINVVQSVRGTSEQFAGFANYLARILIKRRILSADTARRLFATFSVPAEGKLVGAAKALTEEDAKSLQIHGRPLTRRRFSHDLRALAAKAKTKKAEENLQQAVRLLSRVVVGNGIRRIKQLEQFARKKFGIVVTMARQLPNYAEQPWLKSKKPQQPAPVHSLVYFHKVFHANSIPKDKASTYIRKLLELLVDGGVVSLKVARTLLATFDIKAPGKFAPTADVKPWTLETLNTFKVTGNHFAKGNFLNIFLQLLVNKEKVNVDQMTDILSRSLLELSLDNDIIDIRNATELAKATGVKVICRKTPASPPKPEEVSDKEASEENEEEEDEDTEKSVEGGVLISEDDIKQDRNRTTTEDPKAMEVHFEEVEAEDEDESDSDSDSDESKSGDSSESSESDERANTTASVPGRFIVTTKRPVTQAPNQKPDDDEDDDDDDDDDNVKPEKVLNSIVSVAKTTPEKRVAFILHILNLLVDKELIEKESAARIITTFGVDGGAKFPKTRKTVTEDSLDDLDVDGTEEAKEKFTTTFTQLLNIKPDQTDRLDVLVKILLEFAIDNRAIQQKDAEPLALTFGYRITVEVRKVKAELDHNLNLGQMAAFGTKYLSEVEIDESDQQNHLLFADNVLAGLVDNSLIDAATALNLLATFGYNGTSRFGDIKLGKKLEKANISSLNVLSGPDSKKRFLENLEKFVASGKPSQLSLIDLAMELVLDNAIWDIHAAAKLALQYGYSISIKVIKVSSQPLPGQVFLPADAKRSSEVTITGSFAEDLSPFFNQLAGKLATAGVLDTEVSNNIFATFGVSKASGKVIAAEKISKLEVKGDADAKARFLSSLNALVSKHAAKSESKGAKQEEAEYDLTELLKHYLELLLDNKGIPAQEAAQLAVSHGVSISIQETTIGSHQIKA